MLTIQLPAAEMYNPVTGEFVLYSAAQFQIEHSLRSISKWEGKMHKSFFERDQLTTEDFLEYIKCMTINPVKDPSIYEHLRQSDYEKIVAYINEPMTARYFRDKKKKKSKKQNTVTVETIYYAMIEYGIPFECENWHFNRLMALIHTCENNNGSGETMSYRERQKWYNELNDQRRRRLGTKG